MKQTVFAVVLLVTMIFTSIYSNSFVAQSTKELSDDLNTVEMRFNDGDSVQSLYLCEKLIEKWEKLFPVFCTLLEHSQLESFESELYKLKVYISENESSKVHESCSIAELSLKQITDIDRVILGNLL